MKTTKNQAKHLIKRMYEHQWRRDTTEYNNAKKCAFICVDEILRALKFNDEWSEQINYWKEVKKEIQKL